MKKLHVLATFVFIIGLSHFALAAPVITDFYNSLTLVKSGVAGNSVSISGTGFGTTTAANTVKFNGTLATVTAASVLGNALTVTVPAGATTGLISITVAGLTVTSTATFTITTSCTTPVMLSTAFSTICSGLSPNITFSASSTSTYSWRATDNTSVTGESTSAVVSGILSNTLTNTSASVKYVSYTVTPTSGSCVGLPQVVTVTLNPKVAVSPSAGICAGGNKILTATGAASYAWLPVTGLNVTTGSTVTATPAATTTYTVTGSPAVTCGSSAIVTISVNRKVAVTASASICSGASLSLTASGATSYSWLPLAGLSAGTGTTVSANPTTTTTYTVTGNPVNSCGNTAISTVTVKPKVAVTASSAICTGTSKLLTASGSTNYSWLPLTGLSASTGASVTANPTTTITYTVTGNPVNSCGNTASTTLTINPKVAVTASSAICAGASQSLTASGATSYSWSPATGLNASTGTTVVATPTGTTTYVVTGSPVNSCGNTASTTVTIKPKVTVTPSKSICAGASQTLSASGATTYVWSPATGLNLTTGATVTATPSITTTYTVTGSPANGCNIAFVTITVTPKVTVTSAKTICVGELPTLTASGGATYSWTPAATLNSSTGASVIASPTITTLYTVTGTINGCVSSASVNITVNPTPVITITGTIGICKGSSTTLIASGATTYIWTPATGLNITTGTTVIATPTITTTYTAKGSFATGCFKAKTIVVTVTPPGSWLGTTNTDWFTPTNWGGCVPTKTVDVKIPMGKPNMPSIAATGAECMSITIDSAATLTTSGSNNLNIYGDWTNKGTFIPNTGSVTFIGSVNQAIKGNTTTFNNLIVNKTGLLTLSTAANVSQALTLTKGIVETSNGALQLSDNATSTAGTDLTYVSGVMKKAGNDAFTFPLGDTSLISGAYHPLSITAPVATTDVFTAQYVAKAQFINPSNPVVQEDSLDGVSSCENWILTREAGTSIIIPSLGWNANSCNVGENQDLRISGWDGTKWASMGNAGITSNGNQGTIKGSKGIDKNFLPIVLARFGTFSFNTVGLDALPSPYDTLRYKIYGAPGINGTYKSGGVVKFKNSQISDLGNTITASFFGFPTSDPIQAGADSIKIVFNVNKFRKPSNIKIVQGNVVSAMDSLYFFVDNRILALLNGKSSYQDQLPPPINVLLDGGILMSPNNDNSFDNFVVVNNVPVASYHLKISDKNGASIFETSLISQIWNGKDINNNKVPVGNYFFNIDFNGQSFSSQFLIEY